MNETTHILGEKACPETHARVIAQLEKLGFKRQSRQTKFVNQ